MSTKRTKELLLRSIVQCSIKIVSQTKLGMPDHNHQEQETEDGCCIKTTTNAQDHYGAIFCELKSSRTFTGNSMTVIYILKCLPAEHKWKYNATLCFTEITSYETTSNVVLQVIMHRHLHLTRFSLQ